MTDDIINQGLRRLYGGGIFTGFHIHAMIVPLGQGWANRAQELLNKACVESDPVERMRLSAEAGGLLDAAKGLLDVVQQMVGDT